MLTGNDVTAAKQFQNVLASIKPITQPTYKIASKSAQGFPRYGPKCPTGNDVIAANHAKI